MKDLELNWNLDQLLSSINSLLVLSTRAECYQAKCPGKDDRIVKEPGVESSLAFALKEKEGQVR